MSKTKWRVRVSKAKWRVRVLEKRWAELVVNAKDEDEAELIAETAPGYVWTETGTDWEILRIEREDDE